MRHSLFFFSALLIGAACGVTVAEGPTIEEVRYSGTVIKRADGGVPELVQGDDGKYVLGLFLDMNAGTTLDRSSSQVESVTSEVTLAGMPITAVFDGNTLKPDLTFEESKAGQTLAVKVQAVDTQGLHSNEIRFELPLMPNRPPTITPDPFTWSANRVTARLSIRDPDDHSLARTTCAAFLDGGLVDSDSFGTSSGTCYLNFPSGSMGAMARLEFHASDTRDAGVELVVSKLLAP